MNAYVVQYVPLSGLGQPITAELRQVSPKSLVFVHHRHIEKLLPVFIILHIISFESVSHPVKQQLWLTSSIEENDMLSKEVKA